MLGAHLGNSCLLGSHRGLTAEECEDAIISLQELLRPLDYHTLFLGARGRKDI